MKAKELFEKIGRSDIDESMSGFIVFWSDRFNRSNGAA